MLQLQRLMKIQDLGFLGVFGILVWLRRPKIAVAAGLICLGLAIPLFHFWIFFTAERLTWYAGGFILLAIIKELFFKN